MEYKITNYQKELSYSDWPEEQKERARKNSLNYYYKNKELSATRAKKWRSENKEYVKQKQRETKRQRKIDGIYYLGGKCNTCGCMFHPACFEFHHKDPKIKDSDLSKMLLLSKEKFYMELDKCVLLCANCHRLEHHKYD